MTKIPETQGHRKMYRYIQDLIRNKVFIKELKRLKRLENKIMPYGQYDKWTPEQKKRSDELGNELQSIMEDYELLRKRCKRIFHNKYFKQEAKIAELYGLDNRLLGLVHSIMENNEMMISYFDDDADMCRFSDEKDDELSPANKGEEIIHLMPRRQLLLRAYPVAINIHAKASKRDVLDFIEKRWPMIESNLLSIYRDKVLRARKLKHDQAMIDFIWENRTLPTKEIKKKLSEKYPNNGLVYYEINKIIAIEKERRLEEI